MSGDHLVAVCIATRNRPIELARTLTTIAWQSLQPHAVIVVDDSDAEIRSLNRDAAATEYPDARFINKTQPGLVESRNLAAKHCSEEFVMYLDDDVILHPLYIEKVIRRFAISDVGGVGGVVQNEARRRHALIPALVGLGGRPRGRVLSSGWTTPLPPQGGSVMHLSGCNMSFRRELILAHPFDEDYFSGYALGEDAELSHRLHMHGFRLWIEPEARLWHLSKDRTPNRNWGYEQVVLRPKLAGKSFSYSRFLIAALSLCLVNSRRSADLALGNLLGIRDVLTRKVIHPETGHTSTGSFR